MRINDILLAMRADCVPEGECGRWTVQKRAMTEHDRQIYIRANVKPVPPGPYTFLFCLTTPTMLTPPGVVVMNDFPCELQRHLEFVLKARGKVLVGGLGLGCVVRGLLCNPRVESIDIVERCQQVIDLCGDSVCDPRVNIQKRDAYHGNVKGGPWDFVWWDLWSDPEKSEPNLAVIHAELFKRFTDRCTHQGAWAFPRRFRKTLRHVGIL
jgi:hypothetical protein